MLQRWGDEGLKAHLLQLQGCLRARCRELLAAAEQHLGGSGAVWGKPQAGMFLWVKLPAPATDTSRLLHLMREHKVAVLPGSFCASAPVLGEECLFVRLSF